MTKKMNLAEFRRSAIESERENLKRKQLQVAIPIENLKLVNEEIDYEFQVTKVYTNDDRDLAIFVLEAGNENARHGVVDLPAGCERPTIGRYGEAGLKFKVVDHSEVS